MSKEMKDFLNQFMNQGEPKAVELVEKKPVGKLVEKRDAKPKIVKKRDTLSEKIVTSQVKVKEIQMPNTEGVGEGFSAEAFLKSINDKKFSFDKKKNLQIDDQLFSILNLLKQHEDIKSIATLLNAIVEKYVEDNKSDIKRILSKNPLL